MIPKLIHQLWITPDTTQLNSVPAEVAAQCKMWAKLHPDYLHKLWSIEEVDRICSAIGRPDVQEAIRICRFPAMKADIARLLLLYNFGGFWVDLKLRPKRAFLSDTLDFDAVLTQHFPRPDMNLPDDFLINSFIGSVPTMPIIAKALTEITELVLARTEGSVFAVTGPLPLGRARREFLTKHPELAGHVKLLRKEETWDRLFSAGYGTYNKILGHWSVREKSESKYIEVE